MSTGSTMKRSPATNAVMSASRVEREDVPHPDRRQRGDQARQHPQADEQRHADVGDEEHLQPAELLEAERAGGGRGNGEEPIGREPDDEAGGARQRGADDVQQVEQDRLALEADDRHAEDDREQHDRRHDVVRQRVERVRRDVEVDEVEGRAPLEERRAEERRRLHVRKRQRHEHREVKADDPERHQHGAGAQAEPPRVRRASDPRLSTIETVT